MSLIKSSHIKFYSMKIQITLLSNLLGVWLFDCSSLSVIVIFSLNISLCLFCSKLESWYVQVSWWIHRFCISSQTLSNFIHKNTRTKKIQCIHVPRKLITHCSTYQVPSTLTLMHHYLVRIFLYLNLLIFLLIFLIHVIRRPYLL